MAPNIVRAVGQALAFAPLSAVATAGIEAANAGSASALFNMMRNLGGAIGIAGLQTFLTKREQFHSNILTNAVSLFSEATRQRIEDLTAYFMSHGDCRPGGGDASRDRRGRADNPQAGQYHGLQRHVHGARFCAGYRADCIVAAAQAGSNAGRWCPLTSRRFP